jgi:hypothetical protein
VSTASCRQPGIVNQVVEVYNSRERVLLCPVHTVPLNHESKMEDFVLFSFQRVSRDYMPKTVKMNAPALRTIDIIENPKL